MTNIKYTTNTITEIENFFQENFGVSCIKTKKSGLKEGVKYISYSSLNAAQQDVLDKFTMSKYSSTFRVVQSNINERIQRGTLTMPSDEAKTNTTETVSIIVKCSRLVRDNKMSESELSEIISNLYSS